MVKLSKNPGIFYQMTNKNYCCCSGSSFAWGMMAGMAGTILSQLLNGSMSMVGNYNFYSQTTFPTASSNDTCVSASNRTDNETLQSSQKTDAKWKQEAIEIMREFYGTSEKFDQRMSELGDTLGKQYKLYMTSPLYQNVRREPDGVKDRLKKFYDVTLQHYTQLTYGKKYVEISEQNPAAQGEEIENLVKAELGEGNNRIVDNDRDIELAIQARIERNRDNASTYNYIQSLKDRGQGYIDMYDSIQKDGKISEDEFLAFERADAERAGVPFDEDVTKKLFNLIDRSGNGTIEVKEMTAYTYALSRIKDFQINNDGTYTELGNTANDVTYEEWSCAQDIIEEYLNFLNSNGSVAKTERVELLEGLLDEFYNNNSTAFSRTFG